MSINQLLFLFLLVVGFLSCRRTTPPTDHSSDTQTIQLTGKTSTIKLPLIYVRSNVVKLPEDIPYLKTDTFFLRSVDAFFNEFSINDNHFDVLVDTTSKFRFLIIAAAPRFEINEASGKVFDKRLTEHFRQLEEEDLFLEIHKIESKLTANSEVEILKFKYEFVHTLQRFSYYRSIFFLSNPTQSFLIIEVSLEGTDSEEFVWTLKE